MSKHRTKPNGVSKSVAFSHCIIWTAFQGYRYRNIGPKADVEKRLSRKMAEATAQVRPAGNLTKRSLWIYFFSCSETVGTAANENGTDGRRSRRRRSERLVTTSRRTESHDDAGSDFVRSWKRAGNESKKYLVIFFLFAPAFPPELHLNAAVLALNDRNLPFKRKTLRFVTCSER